MVEGDAGAGEGLLNGRRNPKSVAVGGDGDGTTVVHLDESRANVPSYGVGIAALGDLTILYVPPDRRLHGGVLILCSTAGSHDGHRLTTTSHIHHSQ